MFNKLNIKTLLMLVVLLLVMVLAMYYFDAMKGERTFRSELVSIDTSKVDEISFFPLNNIEKNIDFVKTGNTWQLKLNDKLVKADPRVVVNLLATLINLKPERVAATDKSQWDKYEVGDSSGIIVRVKQGGEIVSDLIIGKFSYQQPKGGVQQQNPNQQARGKMTSYVRLNKEDEVYAVEGYLKMNFTMDFNNYRDKALVDVNKDDITTVMFDYPADSSFKLHKQNGEWMLDGMPVDSVKAASYISIISRLMSYDFVADVQHSDTPEYKLTIEGNNFTSVVINAFPADTTNQFIIKSSANPDGSFSGAKSDLTGKIFAGRSKF